MLRILYSFGAKPYNKNLFNQGGLCGSLVQRLNFPAKLLDCLSCCQVLKQTVFFPNIPLISVLPLTDGSVRIFLESSLYTLLEQVNYWLRSLADGGQSNTECLPHDNFAMAGIQTHDLSLLSRALYPLDHSALPMKPDIAAIFLSSPQELSSQRSFSIRVNGVDVCVQTRGGGGGSEEVKVCQKVV